MESTRKWQLFVLLFVLAVTVPAFGNTGWKITFKVSGGDVYGTCKAGVYDEASDGRDYIYDVRAMIGSLNTNNAFCYFPHPEWNDVATDYFTEDIQTSAPGLEKQWIVEVFSNLNGELVLEWPDLQQKLVGIEAYLTDLEGSGDMLDMQVIPSVAFDNVPGETRQFQITIIEPAIPIPETLWAEVDRLRVRLEWELIVDPEIGGYNVWRKLPDEAYVKLNHKVIKPEKGFYLDKIKKKVLNSNESIVAYYKVETVAADPPGQVLSESNEVEVFVHNQKKDKKDDRHFEGSDEYDEPMEKI